MLIFGRLTISLMLGNGQTTALQYQIKLPRADGFGQKVIHSRSKTAGLVAWQRRSSHRHDPNWTSIRGLLPISQLTGDLPTILLWLLNVKQQQIAGILLQVG